MEGLLSGLNSAQRKAAEHIKGPVMVIAGAGSGKTRVLTYRIAHLLANGADAFQILALTFTNKAAREMKERIAKVVSADEAKNVWMGTFHSIVARILRVEGSRLGFPSNFTIYDTEDAQKVVANVIKELNLDKEIYKTKSVASRISAYKNNLITPKTYAARADLQEQDASARMPKLGEVYSQYMERCFRAGAMDFDDLLLKTNELFARFPDALAKYQERFRYLLVDEYQDTSGIQERIVAALARGHKSLCVVGDDDQSIYAWRGAQVSHILEFANRWPGATIVRLEENYRSTPEIIHAANQLIACNVRRHAKTLIASARSGPPPVIVQAQDENDEASRVVSEVESRIREGEVLPNEAVILMRTGDQTRVFEQELRRRGIPYELIGSHSFFDRREVKDVMAFLRLLVDRDDGMALARVVNVPPRGMSAQTILKARDAATAAGHSLWRELVTSRDAGRLPPAAVNGVALLEQMLGEPGTVTASAGDRLRTLLERIDYRSYLQQEYDDPQEQEARWNSVDELIGALHVHEREQQQRHDCAQTIRDFLDELVLDVTEAERFRDNVPRGKVLRLMTLHAAKGLEFDCVWMVGLEEGLLPHHRSIADGLQAIAEERRLCYVGVTRAKKRLTLSLCLTRMKWGKSRPCRPSRFLYELTGQADKFCEAAPSQAAALPGPAGRKQKIYKKKTAPK